MLRVLLVRPSPPCFRHGIAARCRACVIRLRGGGSVFGSLRRLCLGDDFRGGVGVYIVAGRQVFRRRCFICFLPLASGFGDGNLSFFFTRYLLDAALCRRFGAQRRFFAIGVLRPSDAAARDEQGGEDEQAEAAAFSRGHG